MRFPEVPRRGDDAHTDAVRRLTQARDDRSSSALAATAAQGTRGEADAEAERYAAEDRFAAREAWVLWIERGA